MVKGRLHDTNDDRPPLPRQSRASERSPLPRQSKAPDRPPLPRPSKADRPPLPRKSKAPDRPPLSRQSKTSDRPPLPRQSKIADRPPLPRQSNISDRAALPRQSMASDRAPLPRRSKDQANVEIEGDHGVETMSIPDKEDMAFVCGKGGTTVKRIARVAGCKIALRSEIMAIEVRGSSLARRRALQYTKFMIAQRKAKNNPVPLTKEQIAYDCTIIDIPKYAMGYVLGVRGATLRRMEPEHNVIMFICDVVRADTQDDTETLCIVGDRKSRRSAQLELMSTVESQVSGHFLGPWREQDETFEPESDCHGDWGTSAFELSESDVRFLTGSNGRTKKSLSRASDCIVQYVGEVVFVSGTEQQRSLAEDYIRLTLSQIRDDCASYGLQLFEEHRDDRTLIEIPTKDVAYILGRGRETINLLEDEFGVVMSFYEGIKKRKTEELPGSHMLAIFGSLRGRTCAEVEIMSSVEKNDPGTFTRGCGAKTSPMKGIAIDRMTFEDRPTVGYIIGKDGKNLTRISRASGAFVQFVGNILHLTGTLYERRRARDYVEFYLQGRGHRPQFPISGRSDVTVVGTRGVYLPAPELWKIENETGTFCMHALDDEGMQQFFIFGAEEGDGDTAGGGSGRAKAEKMAVALLRDIGKSQRPNAHGKARSRTPSRDTFLATAPWNKKQKVDPTLGSLSDRSGAGEPTGLIEQAYHSKKTSEWRRRDWHQKDSW